MRLNYLQIIADVDEAPESILSDEDDGRFEEDEQSKTEIQYH